MFDDLYPRFEIKEREKDIYKIAKPRERKTRYLICVRCAQHEDDRTLTRDEKSLKYGGSIAPNSIMEYMQA